MSRCDSVRKPRTNTPASNDPPEAPSAPPPWGATPADRQSRIRGVRLMKEHCMTRPIASVWLAALLLAAGAVFAQDAAAPRFAAPASANVMPEPQPGENNAQRS